MKHVTALIIKFVMVAIVLEIILSLLTNLTFTETLYIAAAVTIIAYILGDLIILPASNNIVATISDVVLSLVVIYLFDFIWSGKGISITDALIAAVVIGVGEWIFHKYVANNVLPNNKEY
ncbi:DUF2512 family protein [Clostridium sp. YIM B02551]|uniref:DUF2512 family protein n=1 Tax=Clostridium sp. YIM B02551 TaxID=2910679 RepID=UPI001EEA208C|nr:DUF2512 family protein [Clostridium sp. YIM B02551]